MRDDRQVDKGYLHPYLLSRGRVNQFFVCLFFFFFFFFCLWGVGEEKSP